MSGGERAAGAGLQILLKAVRDLGWMPGIRAESSERSEALESQNPGRQGFVPIR
jgi:hypothetical protein